MLAPPSKCAISRGNLSRALLRVALFRFRRRLYGYFHSFPQIISRVHYRFRVFLQAFEDFHFRSEIAADADALPVNLVLLGYDGDLWAIGAKHDGIVRDHNR